MLISAQARPFLKSGPVSQRIRYSRGTAQWNASVSSKDRKIQKHLQPINEILKERWMNIRIVRNEPQSWKYLR